MSPSDRPNPGYGVTNFDTFPWAFVNVIVVSSLSNWVDIMSALWDTTSWMVFVYMLSIILMASFFAVNVFVVRASGHRASRPCSCSCVSSIILFFQRS